MIDVVEAHAMVLNEIDLLLSNHVAKKDKLVTCFDLEGLRQLQNKNVLWLTKTLVVKTSH